MNKTLQATLEYINQALTDLEKRQEDITARQALAMANGNAMRGGMSCQR